MRRVVIPGGAEEIANGTRRGNRIGEGGPPPAVRRAQRLIRVVFAAGSNWSRS
jgi:hypothetical protein